MRLFTLEGESSASTNTALGRLVLRTQQRRPRLRRYTCKECNRKFRTAGGFNDHHCSLVDLHIATMERIARALGFRRPQGLARARVTVLLWWREYWPLLVVAFAAREMVRGSVHADVMMLGAIACAVWHAGRKL